MKANGISQFYRLRTPMRIILMHAFILSTFGQSPASPEKPV